MRVGKFSSVYVVNSEIAKYTCGCNKSEVCRFIDQSRDSPVLLALKFSGQGVHSVIPSVSPY